MAEAGHDTRNGSHLTLSIWHPDCWTLQVTEDADGGIFGHGVYTVEDSVKGRFTAYGDSTDALESLVGDIESSPLVDSVWRLDNSFDLDKRIPTPGNVSQSLLVMYGHDRSINDSLVSNGFIPDKAVWIHDGREYWDVVIEGDRTRIQESLDAVRDEMDAEIDVRHITSDDREAGGLLRKGILSERQREVFELARERGYYTWPREVSATEIAEELGVSKATTLEHLRKAEAKVIGALP
ncbi:helix-turn-helix domain-containing protein [Haloarchaeobius salinus]|uniref:helix-turn-helix domain-containing protein n=1 Tax=Haloarchaeobius salinus TaxID=1198298 RepID=UPI00210AE540|nr:helix-turn-helix domain-containing protein [Haloarchaeobius salinus]